MSDYFPWIGLRGAARRIGLATAIWLAIGGCRAEPEQESGPAGQAASQPAAAGGPDRRVVVYTSVDEPFARAILERFSKETGFRVEPVFDSEAGKTTGLLRRLEREKERPRCDVWWSSELYGTIELARAGVLEAYDSPAAGDIPAGWRDPGRMWTGMAARARVIAFNSDRLSREQMPGTWLEACAPEWAPRSAVANPQFGTTRGHLAGLFAWWGAEEAQQRLRELKIGRVRIADGNAHAIRMVGSGEVDICWTDTDDVWVAQRRGLSVDLVYPRITDDGPVFWIPCSVALVRGGPNPQAGRALLDYLVSAEVERALATSDSRNVPVRPGLAAELKFGDPLPEPHDFERVADALPAAMSAARDILLR